jgi:antitoxin ParD1/3/4
LRVENEQKLKQKIKKGVDSGESTPLNMSEIIAKTKQQRQ